MQLRCYRNWPDDPNIFEQMTVRELEADARCDIAPLPGGGPLWTASRMALWTHPTDEHSGTSSAAHVKSIAADGPELDFS